MGCGVKRVNKRREVSVSLRRIQGRSDHRGYSLPPFSQDPTLKIGLFAGISVEHEGGK